MIIRDMRSIYDSAFRLIGWIEVHRAFLRTVEEHIAWLPGFDISAVFESDAQAVEWLHDEADMRSNVALFPSRESGKASEGCSDGESE